MDGRASEALPLAAVRERTRPRTPRISLQPEHRGHCLSDDGVGRARRVDPVPEQVLVRSLTEERLIGGHHARLASVRQPVALRIRNDVAQQRRSIEAGDADAGKRRQMRQDAAQPALNNCDRSVASWAAPGSSGPACEWRASVPGPAEARQENVGRLPDAATECGSRWTRSLSAERPPQRPDRRSDRQRWHHGCHCRPSRSRRARPMERRRRDRRGTPAPDSRDRNFVRRRRRARRRRHSWWPVRLSDPNAGRTLPASRSERANCSTHVAPLLK